MKMGYVIVYVPDVGAAVAFYEKAFGIAVRDLNGFLVEICSEVGA